MKAGVVVFPGSNCDQDLVDALQIIGYKKVVKLWHKNTDLEDCDQIFIPGGFSYGDYLRSGAIARFSPIMKALVRFAEQGGFLMGICNGFQILTEAGLLPGALLRNNNQQFICDYTWITPAFNHGTQAIHTGDQKAFQIPIAHGEGRYYAPDHLLTEMETYEQILFRYCTESGQVTKEANPNGSVGNIAGVTNRSKNVFGMMPHPERVVDERLGATDGKTIFEYLFHFTGQL